MSTHIAVTGANGQFGRLVISQLKEQATDAEIIALVRSPEKAADLGVAVRKADYDLPETLATALEGIDTLLLISGSEMGKRAVQHANVVEAAKAAGVKWIIYTSILRADTSTINLAEEHRATEAAVLASGIPYTFLRNGWYNENYAGSIPGAVAGGAVLGSAGDAKISAAARADFAAAAVAVLTSTGHENKIYELAGDTPFTMSELAAEIAAQTGKEIAYHNMSAEEYAATLASFGIPEGFAQAIASWDVAAAKGDLYDNGKQLSALIGRPTTPISATVAATLK